MSTYPNPTTDTDERVIDAMAAAGFNLAADLAEAPRWLQERHYAAQPYRDGWIVADRPDPEAELTLQVLTASGVIRTEVRFDVTELGLAMFTACVAAIPAAT